MTGVPRPNRATAPPSAADLEGDALDAQLSYWTAQLAGHPLVLDLPADHARPPVPSYRGATHHFSVEPGVAEAVRALARDHGATAFMALLGAFEVVLARWCGTDDVIVATPIAGRTRTELEDMVGYFGNTLALRSDLSGDPTFADVVARVRDTALGAYDHQDLPFEHLVAELAPARDLSRNPIAQVAFQLYQPRHSSFDVHGVAVGSADLGGLTGYAYSGEVARFDVEFIMADDGDGGLSGEVLYATDLYEPATMARLAGHFLNVVRAAVADPATALSRLEMLGDDERHELVVAWNETAASYPDHARLPDLVAAVAAATPHAVAVEGGAHQLTYAELVAGANRLARRLGELGVGPGDRVGICVERGCELVVSLLGVLSAGAAYVPVDPDYPPDRVAFMLSDASVTTVVTLVDLRHRLFDHVATVVCLDDEAERAAMAALAATAPPGAGDATDVAYVIYTSGSTGRPKGVAVTHRSVVNLVTFMAREHEVGPGDVVVGVTTPAFDLSVPDWYLPLTTGARLVVAAKEVAGDPVALADLLDACRCSFMQATPSTWRMLVDAGWAGRAGLKVVCGGEAMPPGLGDQLVQRGVRAWNAYGPTETTVWSTMAAITAPGQPPSIGKPLANTTVYVLDGHDNVVPVGVAGELHIGGAGLARGYLGRPDLTAERFVDHPFDSTPGARVYRTGDLARWRPDGELEFLGRLDHQVKVRGYRIECGEVEAALVAHPAVAQAVVVAREDTPGDTRLVGYVVADGPAPEQGELRRHLGETLPAYMVPSALVCLDALPRNRNGKVDRAALPAPVPAPRAEPFVAPRTPTETALAEVWAAVLGVERVGVDDDFFELGGHSLLATQVVARARDRLGVAVGLRALFEAPTVAELAGVIDSTTRGGDNQPPPLEAAAPRATGTPVKVPLSLMQAEMWELESLAEPGSYNVTGHLRLHGHIDRVVLRQALVWLVDRHEPLRTSFPSEDGVPYQWVLPSMDASFTESDLGQVPPGRHADARIAELRAFDALAFDTACGPLFRAHLLLLGEGESEVLLTVDHLIADETAVHMLISELDEAYSAIAGGRQPALADLPLQYADYALWEREWFDEGRQEDELAYWVGRLKGSPAEIPLPYDRPPTRTGTFYDMSAPPSVYQLSLPPEVHAAVNALVQRCRATPFMVWLASVAAVLTISSGQDDLVISTVVSGRESPEVDRVLGDFSRMALLRCDLTSDPPFAIALERVRSEVLGLIEHQHVSIFRVLGRLGEQWADVTTGPFPVDVQFFHAARDRWVPGTSVVDSPPRRPEHVTEDIPADTKPLGFVFYGDGEAFWLRLRYQSHCFDPSTVERLVEDLLALVVAAGSGPDRRVSDLAGEVELRRQRATAGQRPG